MPAATPSPASAASGHPASAALGSIDVPPDRDPNPEADVPAPLRRRTVALISVGATLLGAAALVGTAWAAAKLLDGAGRSEAFRECEIDTTLSGLQGYCVVASVYPEGPVSSRREYLEIAPVVSGALLDYRFVAGYPFTGDPGQELDVDWSTIDVALTVVEPRSGTSITYPADDYGYGTGR